MRPAEVSRLYADGVDAVRRNTTSLTAEDWTTPVCGVWTATETARHLAGVAGWYHDWLDRALAGETSRPFPGAEIDARTAVALAEYEHLSGSEAIAEFLDSATAYLERALDCWDAPYGFPFGIVTVGLHAGVAASEWHLHAWDLSLLAATRHAPTEPGRLLIAAGECVTAAQGGVRGAMIARLLPLAARRAPWEAMLRRAGRL